MGQRPNAVVFLLQSDLILHQFITAGVSPSFIIAHLVIYCTVFKREYVWCRFMFGFIRSHVVLVCLSHSTCAYYHSHCYMVPRPI